MTDESRNFPSIFGFPQHVGATRFGNNTAIPIVTYGRSASDHETRAEFFYPQFSPIAVRIVELCELALDSLHVTDDV